MTITRISALAAALLLLLAVACSSEDAADPTPTEPPQAASAQPTTAPSPTSAPYVSVAPTSPPATAEPSPHPTATGEPEEQDLKIVTLLPFDAIPAVLDPQFISAEEAEAKLANHTDDPDDALVLGLSINGDSRAYYVPSLSAVEIVNDTVGGQPLAVTW